MILIVDDERADLELIRDVVEGAGFQTSVAEDYAAAIDAFRRNAAEIEMAVIDVSIPRRNGVELAIEFLRRKPNLKMLFTSGHVGAEVIRFYGLPATDRHFLQKPFQGGELLRRVREILKSDEALEWLKGLDESEGKNGRREGRA